MLLIDTALRLLSAGQLMLIALVIGRGRAPRPIRWATVLLLLSVAAYLADVAPVIDVRSMAQHDPRLEPVLGESVAVHRTFWLVTHQDTHATSRIQAVSTWLQAIGRGLG